MNPIGPEIPAADERINAQIKRDEKYYFPCVVFLVEDYLFRAPRFYFEQSDVFRDTFTLPCGDPADNGTSDETPLRLDGVKAHDFRSLLRLLISLPSEHGEAPNFTKDEWLGVLKLSDLWNFQKIREESIKQLGGIAMDAGERISLGRKYCIDHWVSLSLVHLAERHESLSLAEAEELGGLSFSIKMGKARDRVNKVRCGTYYINRSNDTPSIVSEIFHLPESTYVESGSVAIVDDPLKIYDE